MVSVGCDRAGITEFYLLFIYWGEVGEIMHGSCIAGRKFLPDWHDGTPQPLACQGLDDSNLIWN
ncbi:hypothetical protein [Laspinema olomoucense]|uniref:hypothetical protein n=1 Tax=Laspinema olomoucense TaxID=3231600 RepID=UPI0021BB9057|nr:MULTISPECIES: hypothetical protein [unclassified Laspinema]MCT7973682.1 hypothetical protein [Laspinema sp. D3d]MCT7996277.1 hypothetical protein [Laspinema sp. D3c]